MSRADIVRNILVLEAFAAEAKTIAARHRARLAETARTELEQEGTAPSWRLPDVARVVLPVSQQQIVVTDSAALQAWVEHHNPEEIEEVTTRKVRASYVTVLLGEVIAEGTAAVWKQTGEIVPGITVRPGGQPGALTITAEKGVKAYVADTVSAMLGTAHAAITATPTDEPVPAVDDPWSAVGDPFALFPAVEPVGGGDPE